MVDMHIVVDKLEAFGLIRTARITGNYQQIYCPFHNNGHERKPSCGILLQDEYRNGTLYPAGWTHCFTCGYAEALPKMVTDALAQKNITQSGLEWLSDNIPGFEIENVEFEPLIPHDLLDAVTASYAVSQLKARTEAPVSYVSEEELASYRFTVPYMYERKLTDELIEKFDIGVDMNFVPPGRKKALPCITFPVRDIQGRTLFFCRRSIGGKFFNYPEGVVKPVYGLYELPRDCRSVVICESCFNALTSWRYGRPAVALLGTSNAYQIQQLKQLNVNEFILAFDPDEAGQKATAKLRRALSSVAIVYSFVGIPPGKDINDLSEEEFNSLELE